MPLSNRPALGWSHAVCGFLLVAIVLAFVADAQNVRGPLYAYPLPKGTGRVSAYFDVVRNGKSWKDHGCSSRTYKMHRGTDFAAARGTPVLAAADGVVIDAVNDVVKDDCTAKTASTPPCAKGGSGWGNHVFLMHSDGRVTLYAHMMYGSVTVKGGDYVTCGQVMGKMAASGLAEGVHLHFAVLNYQHTSPGAWGTEEDPFWGQCAGPKSVLISDRYTLWVDQGTYIKGVPGSQCDTSSRPCVPTTETALTCGSRAKISNVGQGSEWSHFFYGCRRSGKAASSLRGNVWNGKERTYRLNVASASVPNQVTIRVESGGKKNAPTTMFVLKGNSCDVRAGNCVAMADPIPNAALSFTAESAAQYYLTVDSSTFSGTQEFEVSVTCTAAADSSLGGESSAASAASEGSEASEASEASESSWSSNAGAASGSLQPTSAPSGSSAPTGPVNTIDALAMEVKDLRSQMDQVVSLLTSAGIIPSKSGPTAQAQAEMSSLASESHEISEADKF